MACPRVTSDDEPTFLTISFISGKKAPIACQDLKLTVLSILISK
jgi:hypothetical protein